MRILLVEDDAALSLGVGRAFEREGWRVDVLDDGQVAMAEGLATVYDVAVLDLGLPRRDGIEVLRHCRSRGARRKASLWAIRWVNAQRGSSGSTTYPLKPLDFIQKLDG